MEAHALSIVQHPLSFTLCSLTFLISDVCRALHFIFLASYGYLSQVFLPPYVRLG